jgi:hypothetical protein
VLQIRASRCVLVGRRGSLLMAGGWLLLLRDGGSDARPFNWHPTGNWTIVALHAGSAPLAGASAAAAEARAFATRGAAAYPVRL